MKLGIKTTDGIPKLTVMTANGMTKAAECAFCGNFGLLATATSAGGNQGCEMGEALQTYLIPPPYVLLAGKTYTLVIDFSSGDSLYHVGSYYEANYSSSKSFELNWQTSYEGTGGNPWTITNSGKTIRYTLEDSRNCGGSNDNIQTGIAVATITPTELICLDFSFSGIAELQDTGFENIYFYLYLEE
jgi:hypothetical protein